MERTRDQIEELLARGAEREREHDLGPARELLTSALDAASATGLPDIVRTCRQLLGVVAHKAERLAEAREHLELALPLALDAGARTDEAYVRQELGFVLLDEGDPQAALSEFRTQLSLAPATLIVNLAGNALSGMGVAMLQLSRAAEAVPFLLAALSIRAEIGDLEQQHVDLTHLAASALDLGDPATAARIARFLDASPETSAGMYRHDRRSLQAVLDATAGLEVDAAADFDAARRLTRLIGTTSGQVAPRASAPRPAEPSTSRV